MPTTASESPRETHYLFATFLRSPLPLPLPTPPIDLILRVVPAVMLKAGFGTLALVQHSPLLDILSAACHKVECFPCFDDATLRHYDVSTAGGWKGFHVLLSRLSRCRTFLQELTLTPSINSTPSVSLCLSLSFPICRAMECSLLEIGMRNVHSYS